jgi:predicted nucleic acid-binding protein
MGLIIDSSGVVAAERRGDTVAKFLHEMSTQTGDQPIAISSIGVTELVHAIYRAPTQESRLRREAFIGDLLSDIPTLPYTRTTALVAGRIDGEQRSRGITIPSMDLLIGATALEVGYAVVTLNLRHFRLIPGLSVVAL